LKLHAITLCLDSMPWLPLHLPVFEKTTLDWTWHIVHGTANNVGSTAWCKKQEPRLSTDGSQEYINSLVGHPRVKLFQKQWWAGGKDEMVNAPLANIKGECVLMQIDSDEFYTSDQLECIVAMFEQNPEIMRAYFFCRYFVGTNIIITTENGYGNRPNNTEWLRAFRYKPGMKWQSHELPVLNHNIGLFAAREQTRELGLVFDHFSWVNEQNVKNKVRFYGYGEHCINGWRRLQENNSWPVSLKKYLPFVDDHRVLAERIKL
jgi:hypothetical protein